MEQPSKFNIKQFDISCDHITRADLDYCFDDTMVAVRKYVIDINGNNMNADNYNHNDYTEVLKAIQIHIMGCEHEEEIASWDVIYHTFIPWSKSHTKPIHATFIMDNFANNQIKIVARRQDKLYEYMTTERDMFHLKNVSSGGANIRAWKNQMEISMRYCNTVVGRGPAAALFALTAITSGGYACIQFNDKFNFDHRQLIILFARCFERCMIVNTINDFTYLVGIKYIAAKWTRFISCDHVNNIFAAKYIGSDQYSIINNKITDAKESLLVTRSDYYKKITVANKLITSENAKLFSNFTKVILAEHCPNIFDEWALYSDYFNHK